MSLVACAVVVCILYFASLLLMRTLESAIQDPTQTLVTSLFRASDDYYTDAHAQPPVQRVQALSMSLALLDFAMQVHQGNLGPSAIGYEPNRRVKRLHHALNRSRDMLTSIPDEKASHVDPRRAC